MKRKLSGDRSEEGESAPDAAASVTSAATSTACVPETAVALRIFEEYSEKFTAINAPLNRSFTRFVTVIESLYRDDIHYHNWRHAVDVLKTTAYLVSALKIELEPVEILALLVAALVHDAGHVGRSNDVLEKEGHPLAIRYNNLSILEQQSCALCFETLARPDCAFTNGLSEEHAKRFRAAVIRLVLSTDIADQDRKLVVTRAYERLRQDVFVESQREDRDALMILLLRCADIGTVIKSEDEFLEWSRLLYRENSRAGFSDPCNYLERQHGFLQKHVLPEYQLLLPFLKEPIALEIEDRLQRLASLLQRIEQPDFTNFLHSDRSWNTGTTPVKLAKCNGEHEKEEEVTNTDDRRT